MKSARLGCFTASGLFVALATALIILATTFLRGGAMFSPGALNDQAGAQAIGGVFSHAETEGRCRACHSAIWERETMSDRCLACHTELLRDSRNFHAAMLAQAAQLNCMQCHTDHRGVQASLTWMEVENFPHGDAAGYSLQGHQMTTSGQVFACADCHGQEIGQFDPAACQGCHQQIDAVYSESHLAAFGSACLECHDGVDSYGKAFDHNTKFALLGRHAETTCQGCHLEARTIADLQAAPTGCFDCHAPDDAHQGQFGEDCAACHSPEDWESVTFDHSQSAFPLEGRHAAIECDDCHTNNVFQGTPQTCAACHAGDDAHQGQFGEDCAACHTPENWEDASFDHALSAFPLTGAHTQVECAQCHVNNVFKGTPTRCEGCHADPGFHLGLFGVNCAACHNNDGWSPASFNNPHRFPIDHGESGASQCKTCHPSALTAYTCYGCHEHNQANIASEHREEGISDFNDCMRCHPTGREEEGD